MSSFEKGDRICFFGSRVCVEMGTEGLWALLSFHQRYLFTELAALPGIQTCCPSAKTGFIKTKRLSPSPRRWPASHWARSVMCFHGGVPQHAAHSSGWFWGGCGEGWKAHGSWLCCRTLCSRCKVSPSWLCVLHFVTSTVLYCTCRSWTAPLLRARQWI